MFLIEVIPIARGVGRDTLSYFSVRPLAAGSLVTVSVRKRLVAALVVSSKAAKDEKAAIRSLDFSMKKVAAFKAPAFLSEPFVNAAKTAADFSAAPLGSVLNSLIPKAVLEIASGLPLKNRPSDAPESRAFDRLALQAEDEERWAVYRSLIREEFARRGSVFFCLPTAEEVKRYFSILPKGVENYAYAFYAAMPLKNLKEQWRKVVAEEHPVLIIATAPFLVLSRFDLTVVAIENESSRAYKSLVRPFLDFRTFAEFFAKWSGIRFIAGDTLLRTETIFRLKTGEFAELSPLKFRSLSAVKSAVVDMRSYKKSAGGKFEAVSRELEALITECHAGNGHVFIFSARRGLASQTVCADCGTVVLCGRCHSPIVLHQARSGDGNQNFFFCHGCGEKRSAEERCAFCQSWKLQPLGVGIELVETELRKKFPSVKIFRVDKDFASTAKRVQKTVDDFYASPGSVLLGTEMAFAYLDKKISGTAVASLDSLFSLPDFRIHERILHLILKIRSLAESSFLVQTRVPDETVLDYALKGNLKDFYREEMAARERFHYPPFSTLIKITAAGVRAAVTREMEKLKEFFKPFETEIFPAFIEESRGVFTMHALLRLPRGSWVDRDLLAKLLSLPPQFRVEVEPESLL